MPPETMTDDKVVIPAPAAPPPEPQKFPDFSTLVPKEYGEKGWVKDVKDVPTFFKMYDDAKVALSRRPSGIPGDTASPEELANFNKAFGVPEKPEEYELAKQENQDPEWEKGVRTMLHGAGLSKKQAAALDKGFQALISQHAERLGIAEKESDTDFEAKATEFFGENKDKAIASANQLLTKYTPEKFKGDVGGLDNKTLVILSAVLDGIRKDYIGEDTLPPPSDVGRSAPGSESAIMAESARLQAMPEFKDAFHPGHAAVVQQWNALFANLR